VVVLDGGASLPEGVAVRVFCANGPIMNVSSGNRPVELPVFPYKGPPDIDLTNDRIAEILNREDASA